MEKSRRVFSAMCSVLMVLERLVHDEDITSSDKTIDYKASSFLLLHSDFWYNSLGSTCTCHYLLAGTNVSQSASPSKLNYHFVGTPTLLHGKVITHPSEVRLRSMST
jgi:hypothetical protein